MSAYYTCHMYNSRLHVETLSSLCGCVLQGDLIVFQCMERFDLAEQTQKVPCRVKHAATRGQVARLTKVGLSPLRSGCASPWDSLQASIELGLLKGIEEV